MDAMYSHKLEVPSGFRNESMYVYFLEDAGGAAPAGAAPSIMGQIGRGAPPQGAPGTAGARVQPNVVVTRTRWERSLADAGAEFRRQVATEAPNLKVVREGTITLGKREARETEYATIEGASQKLVQWHVTTLRDGHACTFYCTSEPTRWAADKPRFEAFIGGWK